MNNIRFNQIDPKFERDNRQRDHVDSLLEWDFEEEDADVTRPATVISSMPNPEWDNTYDDLSRFKPPGSAPDIQPGTSQVWINQDPPLVDPVRPSVEVMTDEDEFDPYIEQPALPYTRQSADPLVSRYQGQGGVRRVEAVQKALNEALERWWSYSDLPDLGLLRNGLLVLEAGHSLDESQRSLLMRTALSHGKGIHTVLRHQTDPDRTAFLLQEALFSNTSPFSVEALTQLRQEDPNSELWVPLLAQSLTEDLAQMSENQRAWTRQIIVKLQQEIPRRNRDHFISQQTESLPINQKPISAPPAPPRFWALRPAHWSGSRIATTLVALLLLMGAYLWQTQRTTASGWAVIPADTYTISNPANPGQLREVELGAFVIEHTEVTNWQYRRCQDTGVCSPPTYNYSTTYTDYFMNNAFDNYPVVYVTWADANAYCQWIDRHLPSIEEWEVAASIAPATQRYYTYPWGDRFQPELVNSIFSGVRDTQPVGLYHPAGDSSFGAWDMAGNVAEWTETAPDGMEDHALVKGGSYRDDESKLQTNAYEIVPHAGAAPWLGFRCAKRLDPEP